jgi:hypothetical protein
MAPALRSARRRSAAGTGHCLGEVGDVAVAGPAAQAHSMLGGGASSAAGTTTSRTMRPSRPPRPHGLPGTPGPLRLSPSYRSYARDGPKERARARPTARRQSHPVPACVRGPPRIGSRREAARIFSSATSAQPIDHQPELHPEPSFLPTRALCSARRAAGEPQPGRPTSRGCVGWIPNWAGRCR